MSNYPVFPTEPTATIAVGQTLTPAIDLDGRQLVGVFIPATFDGTVLYVQAAPTLAGTYARVQDGTGVDISFTVAAGKPFAVSNLALIAGWQFIKLEAATAQAGTDSVLTLVTRPL